MIIEKLKIFKGTKRGRERREGDFEKEEIIEKRREGKMIEKFRSQEGKKFEKLEVEWEAEKAKEKRRYVRKIFQNQKIFKCNFEK